MTNPDWLLTEPVRASGDPEYPFQVVVRNTNVRIGGYCATHHYLCRDVSDPRYFRTSNTIAHVLCLMANDDTRRFYAKQIAGADSEEERRCWERYLADFERGY